MSEEILKDIAEREMMEYVPIGGPISREIKEGETVERGKTYTMIIRDWYMIFYPLKENKRPKEVIGDIISETDVVIDIDTKKIRKKYHKEYKSTIKKLIEKGIPVYVDSNGHRFITSDYQERV